jgi:hypothetical protein
VTLGPNIGKRWIVMPGLSMVGRIGYGYTWSKIEWDSGAAVPDRRREGRPPLNYGPDLELSLGYAF